MSFSIKQHPRGSTADAFMSAVPMVFGLALTLMIFVSVVVVAHFNLWNQFFFYLLKVSKV